MNNHIKAIARKELRQLLRDKRMLFVLFFFPAFLLVVFGYAINFDVKNIKIAVMDNEKSEISRDFISSLEVSGYFDVVEYISKDGKIKEILDKKTAQAVIVIPPDFQKNYYSNKNNAVIQLLVDGVDGNTASIINKYIGIAANSYNIKLLNETLAQRGRKPTEIMEIKPLFWYNPTLETTKFLLPGLIAMILVITAVISISLSLVREKERGTIEQLNVSSLKIIELLVGKAIPYILISLINAGGILLAGFLIFGIVVKGSFLLLFICTIVFIISSVSLGILISVVAETQQIAFTMATFITLLPSMILSGFIFPIEAMPTIIQIITNITPAKFFIVILRGIILKGAGINIFWEQVVYLIFFTVILLVLSVLIYKKKEMKA